MKINKNMKCHPNKLQILQQISKRDKEVRLAYSTTLSDLLRENS